MKNSKQKQTRKQKQFAEMLFAIESGRHECVIYLCANDMKHWQKKGLTVEPVDKMAGKRTFAPYNVTGLEKLKANVI